VIIVALENTMPNISTESSILEVEYSDLADSPEDRLTCLRSVPRLTDRKRGLYSRRNLKLNESAWKLMLDWISRKKPDYIRVENGSVRILQKYTGHVLIGTTHLISDLDEALESVSEPPPLEEVWLAAKQTLN
jgi:hypothetical protein